MYIKIILLIVFIPIAGFVAWQRFFRNDFNLPQGSSSREETITIKNGEVIDAGEVPESSDQPQTESDDKKAPAPIVTTKKIMITDGVKHGVPLAEIIGGGPPKDGIPSIDKPTFVSIAEADKFLNDSEPGIALQIDGVKRFYPFQILSNMLH